MDIIKRHHFWGLVFVALVLPPVAWNMTAGALNKEFDDRKDALESSFGQIPAGTSAPNDDWINGAQERIDIRRTSNAQSVDRLWQTQKNLISWPGPISGYMANCPYPWGQPKDDKTRGQLPNTNDAESRIYQVTPDLFKQEYVDELLKVWSIAEPLDDGDRGDPNVPDKVVFPFAVLPKRDLADKALPPQWMEMWCAQEDLWLLAQILGAVRDVNASTSSITDSYLKRIEQLELFGGKRTLPNEVAQAAATNANASPTLPGQTTVAANASSRSPVFELAEEYKAVGISASAVPGRPMGGSGMPDAAPQGGATPGADPNADENRYIAKEAAYRTRGFRIKVVIHQRAVPEFVAELLGSEYPIEITRFELAALNPSTPGSKSPATAAPFLGAGPLTPGGPGAGAGSGSGSGGGLPTTPTGDDGGDASAFDIGASTTGATKSAPVNDAVAAAALSEVDLMTLVIVGEMYLYNPPQKKEQDAAAGATNPGTTPAVTPGTTPAVTPGTTPGTTPAVTPGTTPVTPPAPGTTPVTPPAPGTTPVTPPAPGTTPVTPPAPGTTPVTPPAPGTTPVTPPAPGTTPVTPPAPGTTPAPAN